jgi:hypothetical protein
MRLQAIALAALMAAGSTQAEAESLPLILAPASTQLDIVLPYDQP